MSLEAKIISSFTLFPKYSSLWAPTVKAATLRKLKVLSHSASLVNLMIGWSLLGALWNASTCSRWEITKISRTKRLHKLTLKVIPQNSVSLTCWITRLATLTDIRLRIGHPQGETLASSQRRQLSGLYASLEYSPVLDLTLHLNFKVSRTLVNNELGMKWQYYIVLPKYLLPRQLHKFRKIPYGEALLSCDRR